MKIAFLVPDNRDEFGQYESPNPFFGPAPSALLEGFTDNANCEIHIVVCCKRPMTAPPQLASNIFYHQLVVPKTGWMRSLYYGCSRAIRRKLQEINPDIVHGQGTERYCALSAFKSGFPNLITLHGNMRRIAGIQGARPFSFSWLTARLEHYVLSRTDGVLCITTYTQKSVAALAKRTWIVPNAVDSGSFAVLRKPSEIPEILCLANITVYKNQIGLLNALEPLVARIPFRLRFLGRSTPGDSYGTEFEKLVHTKPWCQYPGNASKSEVEAALATAHLLILPTFEDNCPMVVLEAMAAGLPVVAANIGGIPDLIQDGVNGLLCDPASSESIRASVERLLRNPTLAHELAYRARVDAENRFTPKAVAQRHLDVYRDLLSQNNNTV